MKQLVFLFLSSLLLLSCEEKKDTTPLQSVSKEQEVESTKENVSKHSETQKLISDSTFSINKTNMHLLLYRGQYYNGKVILIQENGDTLFAEEMELIHPWRDTLIDLNFDGLKDYAYRYYSGAGCCPRHALHYFLANKDGSFQQEEYLLNWSVDRKRKAIYQMTYGHDAMLVKSHWKKDSLMEVEHVYVYEGTLFRNDYGGTEEILERIPEEYKTVPDYEWALTNWTDGQ